MTAHWVKALLLCSTALTLSESLLAQDKFKRLYGQAVDSTRGEPVIGAFVTLLGQQRATTTDDHGRFSFDSLPLGTYTVGIQHAWLDSLGLSGLKAKVDLAKSDTVLIILPTFSGLWKSACAGSPPQSDSGFLYGMVRSSAGKTIAAARLKASWSEVVIDGERIAEHRVTIETRSDSAGNYALCAMPTGLTLSFGASYDDMPSGDLVESLPLSRILRRDFVIPTHQDAAAVGAVAGAVHDDHDNPLGGVQLISSSGAEAKSQDDGRFILLGVRVGTTQLHSRRLGFAAVSTPVTVLRGETTSVSIVMSTATTLDTLKVVARSIRQSRVQEYEKRRSLGFGHFLDSTQINSHPRLKTIFEEIPSVALKGARIILPGGCSANVFLDNVVVTPDVLLDLPPSYFAAIEIYPRMISTPSQFIRRDASQSRCGSVVAWSKLAFP